MTVKIEDIKEAINTKLAADLTGYKRLPNPYAVAENAMLLMQKAWCVSVGPGNNTQRFVDCHSTWQRDFTITMVNKITAMQNDTEAREDIEKALLVAHRSVLESFETDSTLSGTVIRAIIVSDSGILPLDGQTGKYLAIELVLTVEYLEKFTT